MADDFETTSNTYKGRTVPVIGPTSSREDMLRYIRILEDRLDITGHFKHFKARNDLRDGPPHEDHLPKRGKPATSPAMCPFDIPLPQDRQESCRQMGLTYVTHTQAQRVEFLLAGLDKVALLEMEVAILDPRTDADRS